MNNPKVTSNNRRDERKRKRESVSIATLVNPNFEELSRQFPTFREAYQAALARKGKFEATPEFSLALSRALLQIHWNLQLPHFDSLHHLCPPIPNRYFFVQWLQSVVLPSSVRSFESPAVGAGGASFSGLSCAPLRGLDLGTGAAAIYALLFAAAEPAVTLVATDVDPHSVTQAAANVRANHLESRVQVRLVRPTDSQRRLQHLRPHIAAHAATTALVSDEDPWPKGPLRCSLDELPEDFGCGHLDFCMTNPPFFDSMEGAPSPRADGRERIVMTNEEGSYPGGELAFLFDMIADGLFLDWQHFRQDGRRTIAAPRWTACMCGKKATWTKVKGILHYLLGPSHVHSTEFGPGFLTRWFLAWTWDRPNLDSPLAPSKSWSFTTPVDANPCLSSEQEVLDEIEKRFQEYCASFPAPKLALLKLGQSHGQRLLRVVPSTPGVSTDQDATLPETIQQVLSKVPMSRRLGWLPQQGQFGADVTVSSPSPGIARVSLTGHAHSKGSIAVLDKIQLQLEGEISRCNRKWRRLLQRQNQFKSIFVRDVDRMDDS